MECFPVLVFQGDTLRPRRYLLYSYWRTGLVEGQGLLATSNSGYPVHQDLRYEGFQVIEQSDTEDRSPRIRRHFSWSSSEPSQGSTQSSIVASKTRLHSVSNQRQSGYPDGRITSTRGTAQEIQFGLKFIFRESSVGGPRRCADLAEER